MPTASTDGLLRVGELAARTGASTRSLRHYENQGVISAHRSPTGQRLFNASAIEQVRRVRQLIDAGLPLRVIRELIGCINDPGRIEPCAVPVLLEHLQAYDTRLAELRSTRASLQGLIDAAGPNPPTLING